MGAGLLQGAASCDYVRSSVPAFGASSTRSSSAASCMLLGYFAVKRMEAFEATDPALPVEPALPVDSGVETIDCAEPSSRSEAGPELSASIDCTESADPTLPIELIEPVDPTLPIDSPEAVREALYAASASSLPVEIGPDPTRKKRFERGRDVRSRCTITAALKAL